MTLIEWLDKLDKIAFIIIHHDSDYRYWDNTFLFLRNGLTWIPLYCFILIFALIKFKKNALLFIILSVVTVVFCDRLSAGCLKPLFARPRPCFDPVIQPFLRNLIECGGRYSFPSSHAANHFGLAAFWYWSVLLSTGKKWNWIWLWAILIGYAQIYVGKHYPLDIAAGALLGLFIGNISAKVFENWPHIKKSFLNSFAKRNYLSPTILDNSTTE